MRMSSSLVTWTSGANLRAMAQRAGGGVARIRERRLAGSLALPVHLLEPRFGEVDLPAHLEQPRPAFALQPQRYVDDRLEVGRHVLALDAVAARGTRDEHAVF